MYVMSRKLKWEKDIAFNFFLSYPIELNVYKRTSH